MAHLVSCHRVSFICLLLLLYLSHLPTASVANVTFVEHSENQFDIYLSGIKLFQHNATHPMLFIGQGHTEFLESTGNFDIRDYVSARIPLPRVIVYTEQDPLDLELYLDLMDYYARLEITEDADHALVLRVKDVSAGVERLWLRLVAEPEEQVFGGGEQFSYLNLRGHAFPVWTREQGVGRNKSTLSTFYSDLDSGAGGDYHTTYFPQPTYLSTRGYYLHHVGSDYAVMDFTHPHFHELYVLAERAVDQGLVRVQNGTDMATLTGHLNQYLGRQPPLPDWVHSGAILGLQGGTSKLRGYLEQAAEYRVAVAGVWIQDWVGTITTSFGQRLFWDWTWNQQRYTDLPSIITELAGRGIRVLGYINPYLNKDGQLFAVADEHGYVVKNASNQTFLNDFGEFFCGTIDLTNPDAYQWYKDGSSNYSTLMWAGDQNVDWSLSDGLASTVTAALSLAMSGVTLTHFDIGGFTTFAAYNPPLVRTEELLLRSAEMAVFTPVFRTHEGNQPWANVQYYSSRGTLLKFARLSRMFAAMMAYTNHVVDTSSLTGLPAQRPLFLNYPSDAASYDVTYQYMYGEDVMVAPVYLPNVTVWDLYLPPDPHASWVFLWDESIVSTGGERVRVPAPLGRPPVFYRNVTRFVQDFRLVASEPLVDLPPYVPGSAAASGAAPADQDHSGTGQLWQCWAGLIISSVALACLIMI